MISYSDAPIYNFIQKYFPQNKLRKSQFVFSILLALGTFILFYRIYSIWIITNAHWDLGWIKHVIWRNIPQQMPTDCCSVDGSNTAYISWAWHFTPLFSLLSAVSYLWPFSSFSWLLVFLSIAPALVVYLTCAIFFLMNNSHTTFYKFLIPILLSMTFGTIRALAFPHFEIYFLVFILTIIYFAAKRLKPLYFLSIFFVILLKEDSAFYLIILLWCVFFNKIELKKLLRVSFSLIIIPASYLLILNFINLNDEINPNFPNLTNLESQYLGKPLFSHISIEFLINRFNAIINTNLVLILFIIFITFIGIVTRNNMILRLMVSTIPYFIVALLANSWVKGIMLNYEILPLWVSVFLSILVYYKDSAMRNSLRNRINFIMVSFLLLGLVNGSTKQIFLTLSYQVPSKNSVKNIEDIIRDAKKESVLLDKNFFVYSPQMVSFNSWLNDNSQFKKGSCFIHLPDSNSKQILQIINPASRFETERFQETDFLITCMKS
jgi:hypothetical protein